MQLMADRQILNKKQRYIQLVYNYCVFSSRSFNGDLAKKAALQVSDSVIQHGTQTYNNQTTIYKSLS